ncbi:hypothetical protein [Pontibacter burrus]|uniref:Uncharacterized protein n=1 Tax=Pontibacter burrus TaxID=2704466 RepID=A0A6B3LHV5_9BACT|nr:hypothetical protein [Pontibacter burrus]NEM96169.1 hypothetical protein [Pontibacter burrus]
MTIEERPATYAAVGGRFPNPVVYRIATASSYVKATLYREDGTQLSELKASTREGIATLDVSSFLRAQMQLTIPAGTELVEPAEGSSVAYYCTFEDAEGTVLDDSVNVRFAVAAALPVGTSDYSGYTI